MHLIVKAVFACKASCRRQEDILLETKSRLFYYICLRKHLHADPSYNLAAKNKINKNSMGLTRHAAKTDEAKTKIAGIEPKLTPLFLKEQVGGGACRSSARHFCLLIQSAFLERLAVWLHLYCQRCRRKEFNDLLMRAMKETR
jgi:hypothetical protein